MKLRHLLLLFISFFFVLPLYAEYFKLLLSAKTF